MIRFLRGWARLWLGPKVIPPDEGNWIDEWEDSKTEAEKLHRQQAEDMLRDRRARRSE